MFRFASHARAFGRLGAVTAAAATTGGLAACEGAGEGGGILATIGSFFSSAPVAPPPAYKLTYFDIEGAAEKVRLAFVLYGIDFEDERVQFADWGALKPTTKLGQLPLLSIEGGPPIAQSLAMLRYVGQLGDGSLYPQGASRMLEVDEAIGLAEDVERAWRPCVAVSLSPTDFGYCDGFASTDEGKATIKALRVSFVDSTLPRYLGHIEAQLDKHSNTFIAGDSITIADLAVFTALRKFTLGFIDHVPVACLDTHPKVVAYLARIKAHPKLAGRYPN